jgi:hypothetical protein
MSTSHRHTVRVDRVLNHLNTGTIVERARILRDKFALKREAANGNRLKRFISVSSIAMTGA